MVAAEVRRMGSSSTDRTTPAVPQRLAARAGPRPRRQGAERNPARVVPAGQTGGVSIPSGRWLDACSVLLLQRTVGNNTVTRWLRSTAPDQPTRVATMPPPPIIQRLRSASAF